MNANLAFVATLLAAFASPASACFSPDFETAIIHSGVPPSAPQDAVVLEVALDQARSEALFDSGLRARVVRVIQGHWPGDEVRLRILDESTCGRPFANGTSGLIVGYPRRDEMGAFLTPIQVLRGDGFRLPIRP